MSRYLKGKCSHGFNQLCGASIDSTNSTSSLNSIQFGNKMLGRAIKRRLKQKSQWCDVGLWCTAIGVKKCWAHTALVPFSLTFSCLRLGIIHEYASEITVQIAPCQRHPVWQKSLHLHPPPKNQSSCKKDKHVQCSPKTLQGNRTLELSGSTQKRYTQDREHLNSLPTLL